MDKNHKSSTKGKMSGKKAAAAAAEKPRRPGVEHTYRDYANVSMADVHMLFHSPYGAMRQHNPLAQGSQQQGFAVKLHYMLEDIESSNSGDSHIVSWQPHGRSFLVHNRDLFVKRVLPNYFLQTTFASFQRQLNLYGFKRISSGQDKGGYYNELFLRSKPELACFIQRIKRKNQGPRKPDSPDTEPDFYSMTYLPPSSEAKIRTVLTPKEALLGQSMPQAQQQQQQLQFQQQLAAQYQEQQHQQQLSKAPANASLSLKNLLPASLGSTQQMPMQQQQQQQERQSQQLQQSLQAHLMQAGPAGYNNFMQYQQMAPSSTFATTQQQLRSTMSLSGQPPPPPLQGHSEPTPINPASSISQGTPQTFPFAPLVQAPGNTSSAYIYYSSANNNNGEHGNTTSGNTGSASYSVPVPAASSLPSKIVPMNPPPPLWGGQVNSNKRSNDGSDTAVNLTNDPLATSEWQDMFSVEEEEEHWTQQMSSV